MLRACGAMLLAVVLAAAHAADEQSIRVDVDLVDIYFTVCNQKGRLIPDLRRDSFVVFEDGTPQTITNFSRQADMPLAMVMVIDTSGSVWDKIRFEKQAATEFLYAAMRAGQDKTALFSFDTLIELQQDFTDDPALVASAIRQLRSGGGTRLYDALHDVLERKLTGPEERKAIILITDGDDNSSRRSQQEVLDLAQRHNVSIYAISMNALGSRPRGSDQSDSVLGELASETGGRSFFPTKLEKLASSFKSIAAELRSQYTIAYRSTNPKRDGTFRKVRIEVKKERYAVRARPGYYAPAAVMAKEVSSQ
jgi:Ca-activated chloride channel family protein